uniref:SF3 helicase domain-containing protein n=1 Tax=Fopius arisanus TaxID=64838 RepID=A0A0C9PPQ6_9HYME
MESRSNEQIILMSINRLRPLLRRFCKTLSTGDLYICDTTTGVWHRKRSHIMEHILKLVIRFSTCTLSNEQLDEFLILLLMKEWQKEVYKMVLELTADEDIDKRFVVNEDRFVLNNGMIERGSKKLRKPDPEDYCLSGAGWSFRDELVQRHSGEVRDFFQRLVPDSNELTILLIYLASLMYGKRADDKFLILRNKDDQAFDGAINNNGSGKTTLLSLLRTFFGKYINQRLFVADDVKSNSEKLLQSMTEIGAVLAESRFHRLRIVTELQKQRAVVIPMRSRFVSPTDAHASNRIYKREIISDDTFELWRSAILDYVLDYRVDDHGLSLLPLPRSMRLTQCRREDLQADDPIFDDWIEKHVLVTDNREDSVSLRDVYIEYRKCFQGTNPLPIRRFIIKAERFLRDRRISFTKRYRYTVNRRHYERRNVVHQVRLLLSPQTLPEKRIAEVPEVAPEETPEVPKNPENPGIPDTEEEHEEENEEENEKSNGKENEERNENENKTPESEPQNKIS